jgi:dihydrofolate reductase
MSAERHGRNVVVTMFLSLDGVMEAPEIWHKTFHNTEAQDFKREELFASDAFFLGRNTYEIFAGAWPHRSDETGFADRVNSISKYVVSTSLLNAEWTNTTIISTDPFTKIAELRAEPGNDLRVCGSRPLVGGLFKHHLVDEFRFLLDPVILGRGERLLPIPGVHLSLELIESKRLESGSVLNRYVVRDEHQSKAA